MKSRCHLSRSRLGTPAEPIYTAWTESTPLWTHYQPAQCLLTIFFHGLMRPFIHPIPTIGSKQLETQLNISYFESWTLNWLDRYNFDISWSDCVFDLREICRPLSQKVVTILKSQLSLFPVDTWQHRSRYVKSPYRIRYEMSHCSGIHYFPPSNFDNLRFIHIADVHTELRDGRSKQKRV